MVLRIPAKGIVTNSIIRYIMSSSWSNKADIRIEEDDSDGQLYVYNAYDNTGMGTKIEIGETLSEVGGIDYDPVDDKVSLTQRTLVT